MLLISRKHHDFLAVVEIMFIKTFGYEAETQQGGQSLKREDPGLRLEADSMIRLSYTSDWGWAMKIQINHMNKGKANKNTNKTVTICWHVKFSANHSSNSSVLNLKGCRRWQGIVNSRLSTIPRFSLVPQILLPKSH